MSHKLIVGQTLSGKSTLARSMANAAIREGLVVVVYDPTLSPDWGTDLVTDDEEYFFQMLEIVHAEGHSALVIVDEADTLLSMAHRHNWWLFMRGRHFGFELVAVTQRPTNIAPSVRGNAPELYVFQLGNSDATMLEQDYGAQGISAAPELRQGEFLAAKWVDGKKTVEKFRVF